MTTLVAAPRHPFELLLEQLTGRMSTPGHPIHHRWGTQADAAHTNADRIAWIPGNLDPGVINYELDNAETVGAQLAHFDVSIYGGSPAAVYQLHKDLWAWLDVLVGPKQGCPAIGSNPARSGYEMGACKVEPRGGDLSATGWGTIVSITLKDPVVRRFFPLGTVQEVSVSVVTTKPDGSAEQAALSTEGT
jgi:hypothetical protein